MKMNKLRFRSVLTFMVALLVFISACSPTASTIPVKTKVELQPLKIFVAERGMVQITAQELKAQQVNVDGLDLRTLSLTLRGEPQPLWITGSGNELRLNFFGNSADSVYTSQNVYVLQTGSSSQVRPMTEISAAPNGLADAGYYTQTVRMEENLVYSPLVEKGDHWFIANLPAGQTKTFSLKVDNVLPKMAILRLQVWSSTTASTDPNHHLRVKLNDQVVIDELWGGIGNRLLQGIVPEGLVKAGDNRIVVEAPGDTGAVVDTNFLNWIELDYAHAPNVSLSAFEVAAIGEALTLQTGSVDDEVFEISEPGQTTRLVQTSKISGQITFQTKPSHHYWVVRPDGYIKPAAIQPALMAPDLRNLTDSPNGADYLAIGPEDLLQPLKPLLDLHRQQGLHPAQIPLQAVYDQFNDGFPEPDAIRWYLGYASQNWQVKPRYVLLVGDATYDPRGNLAASEANQLPIFFVSSLFGGQTGSDIFFSVPENEILPTMAVGRIPAQEPKQVSLFVEKVLRYEKVAEGFAGTKTIVTDRKSVV